MRRPPLNAAFKRWFKGSKIVDGDGRPLVCYHMTASDFDRFEIGVRRTSKGHHVSGPAIWFATDPAKTHAAHNTYVWGTPGENDLPAPRGGHFRGGVRVLPCYLRVVNPLEIWPTDDHKRALKAAGLPSDTVYLLDSDVRNMKAMGIDGAIKYADDLTISEVVIFAATQAKGIFNRGTWSRRSSGLLDGLLP